MNVISICVGSSCAIKGSDEVIALFRKAIKENNLEDKITLKGAFCLGKCNREGVSVTINETIYTGVNASNFNDFWNNKVLPNLK